MGRTTEEIQNELLVLQSQAGDREALKRLIEIWQPRLAALAWRMTNEREAARDVVQDAWLAILRGLRRLDDPARFRTWAYRIVAHKCTDWVRRRGTQRQAAAAMKATASDSANASSQSSSDNADVVELRAGIAALPGDQRTVLALHYLDGMSLGDIAKTLKIPVGTVKSRLHYARNALKERLEGVT